jgi:hypothetical protein
MTFTFSEPHHYSFQEANPLDSALKNALINYQKNIQAQYAKPNAQTDLLMKQLHNQYYGPKTESQINLQNAQIGAIPSQILLRNAQAARADQLTNMPFGGQLSGAPKEAFALELLKQKYGENSKVFQDASRAYQTNVAAKEALTNYRGSLTETADKRAATSLGKSALELEDVNAGFMPGSNRTVQLDPQQQDKLRGQYQLQIQKQVTDAQARQKNLLASNIDKTIDTINIPDLTQFAGAKGAINLKEQETKAPFGKESQEYRNYLKAVNSSEVLAHQVRQFYGDSIQPSMTQALARLTNPASWANNPKIATQNFNNIKNILKKETQTYRDALKSTKAYEGGQSEGNGKIIDYVRDASGRFVPAK